MQEDQLYHHWGHAGSWQPTVRHRRYPLIRKTALLSHWERRWGQCGYECDDAGILSGYLHDHRRAFGQSLRKASSYAHRNDHHLLITFHRSYSNESHGGSWKHHCFRGIHACAGFQRVTGPNHHAVRSVGALKPKTSNNHILGAEPHHHSFLRFPHRISGNLDYVHHLRIMHLTLLAVLQQISRLDQGNIQEASLVIYRGHQIRMGKVSTRVLYLHRQQNRRPGRKKSGNHLNFVYLIIWHVRHNQQSKV